MGKFRDLREFENDHVKVLEFLYTTDIGPDSKNHYWRVITP